VLGNKTTGDAEPAKGKGAAVSAASSGETTADKKEPAVEPSLPLDVTQGSEPLNQPGETVTASAAIGQGNAANPPSAAGVVAAAGKKAEKGVRVRERSDGNQPLLFFSDQGVEKTVVDVAEDVLGRQRPSLIIRTAPAAAGAGEASITDDLILNTGRPSQQQDSLR
jgi:hypothetical protein